MKNAAKLVSFPFVFGFGFLIFLFSGKTKNLAYASFRYLFVLTNGRINDFHSRLISLISKPKTQAAKGILGDLNEKQIDEIVASVKKNGYYEFDVMLGESELADLFDFANNTPTKCIDVSKKGVVYHEQKVRFDGNHPISPRYQFDTTDVVANKAVRKIIFDPCFRTIAGRYLNCQPILDIVTMWWSVPFQNKGTSQAAQMFHFDMDRFKFIKFFFYLTDVHTDNGPHCYVRGSHKTIPAAARKDRRMEDDELLKYYPEADFREFVGKKGTILAVDTRGLHKGKPLVKDNRLLFQIQFSNSLFGAPYEWLKLPDCTTEEKEIISSNPRTYKLAQRS